MDLAAKRIRRGRRLAPRSRGAPHHLVALAGAAGAARSRHALLSPLPAQPHAAGALSAPRLQGDARWRAAPAGDYGAELRGALHAEPGAHTEKRDATAHR